MSTGEFALVAAGIAGAAYLLRRRSAEPGRASWDVPPVQERHAELILRCAALYRADHGEEARSLLRDRAVDWELIRAAAAAQLLDPTARRIAAAIERDGSGMFLNELHRLAATDRDLALETLARALGAYTGAAGEGESR